MKRIIAFSIIGIFFIALVSACGTSRANCDAYGLNDNVAPAELNDSNQV